MSHAVEPEDLETTSRPYGTTPFLLYVGASGTARVNHVAVDVRSSPDAALVRCTAFGRGVPDRVRAGATFSLLWPPHEAGGFSLIADGTATMMDDDQVLELAIDGAVLHRPAPQDGGASSC